MKSLLVVLAVLALAAAALSLATTMGYLTPLLNEVRADVYQAYEAERTAMIDHAQEAVRSLRRGHVARAQEELQRLDELMEQAWATPKEWRISLRRRLEEAKQAVSEDAGKATDHLEAIIAQLSPGGGKTDSPQEAPAQPQPSDDPARSS
jgi:DNA repair photolyase